MEIKDTLSISKSTVEYVCNEPNKPDKANQHISTSRFHDTPAKARLTDFVESSAEARRLTWAELIHHQGLTCSDRTIRRYLHDAGFRRYLAIPKPWLIDKQKEARLSWTTKYADWDLIDWGA